MDRKVRGFLEQLLSLFWLRPETALWRTLDCVLMRQESPPGAGLDLGCGTGLLSYIMAGGKIDAYDTFMNVQGAATTKPKADYFDTRALARPILREGPVRYRFAFGVDHKAGLLDQARLFKGFYRHTLQHDLDKALPFRSHQFDWAFSNILYWLKNIPAVLRDWNRVLKPSGRLYLFVPNQHFKDRAWIYYKAPHRGTKAYLNFFDRGYNALVRHGYSRQYWEHWFKAAQFRIRRHQDYLSRPVMDIWNIGLAIAPLLMDMAQHLKPRDRETAKSQWVKYFKGFFEPVIKQELSHRRPESDCAFHFFVLEKL